MNNHGKEVSKFGIFVNHDETGPEMREPLVFLTIPDNVDLHEFATVQMGSVKMIQFDGLADLEAHLMAFMAGVAKYKLVLQNYKRNQRVYRELSKKASISYSIVNPNSIKDTPTDQWVDDIEYIRRRYSKELGFLALEAIAYNLEKDHVRFAMSTDGRILGFIMWTYRKNEVKIQMLCVKPDYRRQGIGTALTESAIDAHQTYRCSLRVREDLAAVKFWEATGFAQYDTEHGNNKEGIAIKCFAKTIGEKK